MSEGKGRDRRLLDVFPRFRVPPQFVYFIVRLFRDPTRGTGRLSHSVQLARMRKTVRDDVRAVWPGISANQFNRSANRGVSRFRSGAARHRERVNAGELDDPRAIIDLLEDLRYRDHRATVSAGAPLATRFTGVYCAFHCIVPRRTDVSPYRSWKVELRYWGIGGSNANGISAKLLGSVNLAFRMLGSHRFGSDRDISLYECLDFVS